MNYRCFIKQNGQTVALTIRAVGYCGNLEQQTDCTMNTTQIPHTIHPTNYGPIQALQQRKPTQSAQQETTVLVDITTPAGHVQPEWLTFIWRPEINCWYSEHPLCIRA